MSVIIGPREFEGPYSDASELRAASGIYAVFRFENDEYELLEVSESENVKAAFSARLDRLTSSMESSGFQISVVAHYTASLSKATRQKMVQDILQELQFVTGQ